MSFHRSLMSPRRPQSHGSPGPVDSLAGLRKRVDRLLKAQTSLTNRHQLSLALNETRQEQDVAASSFRSFLDFIANELADGGLFLFGGVLRDLALMGTRRFASDIDMVVTENWDECRSYLESKGAIRNKFGGFRLRVAKRPVDIWSAQQTWAIREGIVEFNGIMSLTETTAFNWDAILMNWTRRSFILRTNYLEDIQKKRLDIVLKANPNPLGTAIRAFRYAYLKDANEISPQAAQFMAEAARCYSFERVREAEFKSFGNTVLKPSVYRFFADLRAYESLSGECGKSVISSILNPRLPVS